MKFYREAVFVTWIAGIMFAPGENDISDKTIKKVGLLDTRAFKHEVKMGRLRIMMPSAKVGDIIGAGMKDWRRFNEIIKETDDLAILSDWKVHETRKGCQAVLTKRIAEVSKIEAERLKSENEAKAAEEARVAEALAEEERLAAEAEEAERLEAEKAESERIEAEEAAKAEADKGK